MIYDALITLGAVGALPKWLLQKKYRGSLRERFALTLPPQPVSKPVIWLHGVSMGETRALLPIYDHLQSAYPNASIYISSTTQTGHIEARRLFPKAAAHFYLPIDHSYVMRRVLKRLQPSLLILSETDLWYNQLRLAKKMGARTLLVNGKISESSARRFAKVPAFTRALFFQIDHLCVQSDAYKTLFEGLGVPQEKLTITGNLKLAIPPTPLTQEERQAWQERLGLSPSDTVITLGSTHEGEEELLLPLMPKEAKILLIPRHPERFAAIKKKYHKDNVHVVDQMGVLTICYQLSDLALVGGSFLPGVGGHNIYEPIQAGIPVIFGPHMSKQEALAELILENNAGLQTEVAHLPKAIERAQTLFENARALSRQSAAPLAKTEKQISSFLSPFCV